MTIRVNYNPMSVLTHRNLVGSDRLMSGILDRLSSGERLRRSADDPASMVVANAVRYHRTGITRAQSNAEEAVTMLQTAEGAMDQISQVLQRVRSLAVAALSTATMDAAQASALQTDLEAGIRSITTIATSTSYGGNQLLDGTLRDMTLSDEAKAFHSRLMPDWRRLPGGISDGSSLTIRPATGQLTKSSTTLSYGPATPGSAPATALTGTLDVTGPEGTVAIAIPPGTTIDGLVSTINAHAARTGVRAAYDETTGDITVASGSYGSAPFSVSSVDVVDLPFSTFNSAFDQTIDVEYVDASGATQIVTLAQDPTSPGGLTFTNIAGGPEAVEPYSAFAPGAFSLTVKDTSDGSLLSAIDPAGADVTATRAGTTAFQIGALSSQRVTVEIPDLRAGALGSSAGMAALGFASLDDLLARTGPPAYAGSLVAGDASETLAMIDAAIAEVNRARGNAGALQGNTVERVMDSLQVSTQNLKEFESILRDVDMAAESAEYARVQVMIQAATAMLAQANQVPQTILQLLK